MTSLASFKTADIAASLGVNPKALRSALRRNGISLRYLRENGRTPRVKPLAGVVIRHSGEGVSAIYGAEALAALDDAACRWPVGDPSEPQFAFCGAPRSGRWPYCPTHVAQAFACGHNHEQ